MELQAFRKVWVEVNGQHEELCLYACKEKQIKHKVEKEITSFDSCQKSGRLQILTL
jgi:hypothetical protein